MDRNKRDVERMNKEEITTDMIRLVMEKVSAREWKKLLTELESTTGSRPDEKHVQQNGLRRRRSH
jgi:hypothetical protein